MRAKIDRTGERRLMNCGEYATIIRYGSRSDIDVQFDSGETVYNREYRNFTKGNVAKSDINRVGERRLMNCGEYATIIKYNKYIDIDVQFDSGEIVYNKSYNSFVKGSIAKPKLGRVGERRLMSCGKYATIIRYGSYKDIDVKFDSGEIVYNRRYSNFINGSVSSPVSDRVGERRLMTCREYATIIRYNGSLDIDVQFDSGEIVYNKSYRNFIRGSIAKPVQDRVGERRLMTCGEYATIIRYGSYKDIDVKFDTGEISYNKMYNNFLRGRISKSKLNKVGERRLMNCGLYASIIRYAGYRDIDIEFESGDIVKSYNYYSFIKGFCSPSWYNHHIMRMCYYDNVLGGIIILMKDGRVLRKPN